MDNQIRKTSMSETHEHDKLFAGDDRSAFISDTIYRLTVETVRIWVIEAVLRTGELPSKEIRYCYADGPVGFDWGNSPGEDDPLLTPLRGKRVQITFEIQEV